MYSVMYTLCIIYIIYNEYQYSSIKNSHNNNIIHLFNKLYYNTILIYIYDTK